MVSELCSALVFDLGTGFKTDGRFIKETCGAFPSPVETVATATPNHVASKILTDMCHSGWSPASHSNRCRLCRRIGVRRVMPAEFTRISTLPNSAQTANLNDRLRRGWRANSARSTKKKPRGTENHSDENSTEELAHFLPTKLESGTGRDHVEIIAPAEVPMRTVPHRCRSADIGGRRVRR